MRESVRTRDMGFRHVDIQVGSRIYLSVCVYIESLHMHLGGE